MNCLIFDIETVPDTSAGQHIYELSDELSQEDVAQVMFTKRREKAGHEFLALPFHKIVAISIVLRSADQFHVWSLGDINATEKEILSRFFAGIEHYTPSLVTWNGSGFDLPVIHYRALINAVSSARYWESGDNDRDFKYNNYLNRYHARHIDLMDVLSGFVPRAVTSLDVMAGLLGLPGKMGMSGASVWDYFKQGELKSIRDYCETDVLNTYLVYLRWLLIAGRLDEKQYIAECQIVSDNLNDSDEAHLKLFLAKWQQPTSV